MSNINAKPLCIGSKMLKHNVYSNNDELSGISLDNMYDIVYSPHSNTGNSVDSSPTTAMSDIVLRSNKYCPSYSQEHVEAKKSASTNRCVRAGVQYNENKPIGSNIKRNSVLPKHQEFSQIKEDAKTIPAIATCVNNNFNYKQTNEHNRRRAGVHDISSYSRQSIIAVSAMFGESTEIPEIRTFDILMAIILIVNIAVLACETVDGPHRQGSSPEYEFVPGAVAFMVLDAIFTLIFSLEFIGRILYQKCTPIEVIRDPICWIDFLSLCPFYLQMSWLWFYPDKKVNYNFVIDFDGPAHIIGDLRILRALRLMTIFRNHNQAKILKVAIVASWRPIGIVLFFLFTLVIILATALFYAEPCYNIRTCTFTDIINSAYFVMVTVATVGYGGQTPDLLNITSVLITAIAMIFGQLYFAMPLAIIGNNFQATCDQYDRHMENQFESSIIRRGTKIHHAPDTLNSIATKHPLGVKTKQSLHSRRCSTEEFRLLKQENKTEKVTTDIVRLCDMHYHVIEFWQAIQLNLDKFLEITQQYDQNNQVKTRTDSFNIKNAAESSDEIKYVLASQEIRQELLKRAVARFQEFHRTFSRRVRNSEEAIDYDVKKRKSLGVLPSYKRELFSVNDALKKLRTHKAIVSSYSLKISSVWRRELWLVLECPDSSTAAHYFNRVMVFLALLSIFVFCCESLPELMLRGPSSEACQAVVGSYCKDYGGLKNLDRGCFVHSHDTGLPDYSQPIIYGCQGDESYINDCYGYGHNFGTPFHSACTTYFEKQGQELICYQSQCVENMAYIFDATPYWIYIEWLLGSWFVMELILRLYACENRRSFFVDGYNVFDGLAIIPFVYEVIQKVAWDIQPTYTITATAPSFLSVIRVLKTTRLLKLTRHFRGTQVLATTAKETMRPLLIPMFFLLIGSMICGAMFYEIERGTECLVGKPCMWWNKNVLTPKLAAGLPIGKRVMIQDMKLTTIKDLLRGWWLSLSTFTTVGYGDLVPRTSLGKLFCIFVGLTGTMYQAMPLSLVGGTFYRHYEKYLEKSISSKRQESSQIIDKKTLDFDISHNHLHPMPKLKLNEDDIQIIQEFNTLESSLSKLLQRISTFHTTNENLQLIGKIKKQCSAISDAVLRMSIVVVKFQNNHNFGEYQHLKEVIPMRIPTKGSLRRRSSSILQDSQ